MFMLLDDEREKVNDALVETDRVEAPDSRELARCRFSSSEYFLAWEAARLGAAGSRGLANVAAERRVRSEGPER
jgi:hypothetical protein